MKAVKIRDNIYWVGGIDWSLRNFHGYLTQRGSTYNAYLIIDEKVTLIDTVKHYLFDEMMERIASVIDPARIDTVICNHVEMDHSGAIPRILPLLKSAKVYASPKGVEGLAAHYSDLEVTPVKTGDSISIGSRTLSFVQTPMVHWPDNMVTYCPQEKILFSNDAFGQHIASSERFDDEFPLHITLSEAAKYYANIVLPYGNQVKKALDAAAALDIELIAPSHGIMWRKNIGEIIANYSGWCTNQTARKGIVIYDTMWDSTRKIAQTIHSAFEDSGIVSSQVSLQDTHISDIMTELLTTRYIAVGSPTLNNTILPTLGAFLTYMRGLAPKNRYGLAFGSYGWGGQSVPIIHEILSGCGFTMLEQQKCRYIPSAETLGEIYKGVRASLDSAPALGE